MAGKRTDIELRERLVAWLRYLRAKYEHRYETQEDFARFLGLPPPLLSQYLNRRRTPGLDLLSRVHRACHVSADVLLDTDPPLTQRLDDSPPSLSSQAAAAPGRRRGRVGGR